MVELSGRDSQMVQLRLYHGLSFAQVGKVLGISRSETHRIFGRAILRLRALLNGFYTTEEKGQTEKPAYGSIPEEVDSLNREVQVAGKELVQHRTHGIC